ncbi:MAG: PQQ-binding-like beta-propeller repeat protein [Candidatus Sedimenticola sp. 20ELBAFRAG]
MVSCSSDAVSLSRRRLLSALLLLPAAPLAFAEGAGRSGLSIVGRWPTGNQVLAPFTLQKGRLYLNGDATLESWDVAAGERLWHKPLPDSAVFRPRISGDTLISCGRSHLACFRAGDGEQLWSYQPEFQLGVPVVSDQSVFLGEGNRLLALDIATGKIQWSFPINPKARIAYAPVVSDGVVYLGPGDGLLYAIRASDGQLLWQVDREQDWQYLRQLQVSNGVLVAGGYHDELFGLDPSSGRQFWRFNAGNFINSQHVSGDRVYFWSPTGWIYALSVTTGNMVWRHRTNDFVRNSAKTNWAPIMAELISDEQKLYVLAMDDVLHILDTQTGKKLGEFDVPVNVRPFLTLGPKEGDLIFGSATADILVAHA